MTSEERAAAENARNAERKQERGAAEAVLTAGSANAKLSEIAKQGGTVGRRLEREIRRFERTGRVSGWLAGETLKAEAAQNAAQQSAFREQVLDVISNPMAPIQVGPTNIAQGTQNTQDAQQSTASFPTFGYIMDVCIMGEAKKMDFAVYSPPSTRED